MERQNKISSNLLLGEGTVKSTGKCLMEGWKKNSITFGEYADLCKTIGKSEALRQHTPIMTYTDRAYGKYREMCYYLAQTPLNKGAWMRSSSSFA